MITHLFFDLGYTLINEDRVWERRCTEQAQTVECRDKHIRAQDIMSALQNASRCRQPQYETALKQLGLHERIPYRSEFETLYLEAIPTLKALSVRYRLCILANQSDGLQQRLRDFGIATYFRTVVSSAELGISKPDPRIFRYALTQSDCTAPHAVMIGDRLDNDILPAIAIGMHTIWIRQGIAKQQILLPEDPRPDHIVNKLSELLAIL